MRKLKGKRHEQILKTMDREKSVSKTARLLGISNGTVYYHIDEKYRIHVIEATKKRDRYGGSSIKKQEHLERFLKYKFDIITNFKKYTENLERVNEKVE